MKNLACILLGWTLMLMANPGYAGPFQTLDLLYRISGQQTLSGHHNREPSADPTRWTDQMYAVTGQYPALWSGDFLFQANNIANRGVMIEEAKKQWEAGAVINLMWHACNPAKWQPCGWDSNGVLSQMSDWEWDQLLTNGTAINRRWKEMMDEVAVYLQDLEDSGVEVLFRPLHEMNQGIFWWGGRPGENGTRRLYQITHDYFTNTRGLTNIIWVWDVQDFGSLVNDLRVYNPGDAYWDVAALDVYEGFATWKYNAMVNMAGSKPIGIGETDKLPSPQRLAAERRWTFFMGWSELPFEKQSNREIQNTYFADTVTNRAEMPGWDQNAAPNVAYKRPVTVSSTQNNYPAKNSNDADGNTRWSSQFSDDQWIYVDLGEIYAIERIRLAWEAAYARRYTLQVSDDAQSWTTVRAINDSNGGSDNLTNIAGWGRYVRIQGVQRATPWGYSLYELEVYGEPASKAMPHVGATYRLIARHSGKALDVAGGVSATADGVNVQQWSVNGQANQDWRLEATGDGFYHLTAAHSGKALEAAAWSTVDGGNIQQWPYLGKANQQWRIEPTGDGYYRIINRHSGKLLDVAGGPGATGDEANIQQWRDNGQANQQWRFEPVTNH